MLFKLIVAHYPFKENLVPVGFEPATSGTDLPVLYRLSYEATTGAGRGNLGSKFAVSIPMKGIYILYTYLSYQYTT